MRASDTGNRPLAPAVNVGEHEAAVHCAAEYTIHQETKHGFLYGALQAVAGVIDGIIREVGSRL